MPRLIITLPDRQTEIDTPGNRTLDEILLGAGFIIERQCAGRGTCGRCRIMARGNLSEPTAKEIEKLGRDAIIEGWRLACQALVAGDAEVSLPRDVVHTDKIFGEALSTRDLPERLGLALDLGTTTVGAFLTDLDTGRVLGGNAVLNKQSSFGADVISRLEIAVNDPERFSSLARDSLNEAIEGLKLGSAAKRIQKAVVVGNTAMHHLLLSLPTDSLRVRPFEPSDEGLKDIIRPRILDRDIEVRCPPVIGGFVGSDTLACLAYFGFDKPDCPPAMAADLGTNGEVMVTDGRRILVSSTAAGPAFEGVNISCGMRASPGAVIRAHAVSSGAFKVILDTIGGLKPAGLAGSGLLSFIRLMRDEGLIEVSGRIIEPDKDARGLITKGAEGKRIFIAKGMFLTQSDIREMQKAKGAVRACAEVLLTELDMTPSDLKRVYLTGSFGGRLDYDDVLKLGVIPQVDPAAIISVPNGAGLGAALFLQEDEFQRACELSRRVEHVGLFDSEAFMEHYIANMALSPEPSGFAGR